MEEIIITLYEKRIEIVLGLLGIIKSDKMPANSIKLEDNSNIVEEIKAHYTTMYGSNDDDKLITQAIRNLMPNLYVLND